MPLLVCVLVRLGVLGAALAAYYATYPFLFPDDGGGANIGAGLIAFAGLGAVTFLWSLLDARRTTFVATFTCWAVVSGVYAVVWIVLFALAESDPSMGTRETIVLSFQALLPVTIGTVLLPAVVGAAIGSSASTRSRPITGEAGRERGDSRT